MLISAFFHGAGALYRNSDAQKALYFQQGLCSKKNK